jgi:hypothetical protein
MYYYEYLVKVPQTGNDDPKVSSEYKISVSVSVSVKVREYRSEEEDRAGYLECAPTY